MIVRRIERRAATKRVAAYARVSTVQEEQELSFETQKQYYTTMIANMPGWQLAQIYSDQGITGLSAAKRPGFLQMIADAQAGLIDIVLCKSVSRFSRNFAEAQKYVHMLKGIGIEVRFEKEGLSTFDSGSDLLFSTMAAVAQEESRSISENVKWAYKRKADQGIRHLGSNRILGYDEIDGTLTPNENASTVHLIFEKYAAGAFVSQIIKLLASTGAHTLRGNDSFSYSQIMAILKNNTYTGDRTLQKVPHKNYLTKKPDPQEPYTSKTIQNAHTAIIERNLWNIVQERLQDEEQKRSAGIRTRAGTNAFYGRVVCSVCGLPYRRVTYKERDGSLRRFWKCTGRIKGICSNGTVSEEEVARALSEQNTISISPSVG